MFLNDQSYLYNPFNKSRTSIYQRVGNYFRIIQFDNSIRTLLVIVGYPLLHYSARLRMECNGRKYCCCRRCLLFYTMTSVYIIGERLFVFRLTFVFTRACAMPPRPTTRVTRAKQTDLERRFGRQFRVSLSDSNIMTLH